MVDWCAVGSVRLSPCSTLVDGRQLGDGERMNCENISSSPRAVSADKISRDGDISVCHAGLRGMSFITGLLYMLSTSRRKGLVVVELSVNSGRGLLQAIVVSWLRTKDGQTVGLVVRAFFDGLVVPDNCEDVQVRQYSSLMSFLFRVESPRVVALLGKDSPEHSPSSLSKQTSPGRVRLNPWLSIKWNWKIVSLLKDVLQDGCGQEIGHRHSRRWSLTWFHSL